MPDAMRCTRCSYCKYIPYDLVKSSRFAYGCPSIKAGKFHSYSAGGKLVTALSLMDGRSEVTDKVVDIAFKCQLCGNCDVACKMCRYDMEPIMALREFRAHLVEMDRVPESYRPIIERTRAAMAGKGPKTPADRNAWAEGLGLKDPSTEAVDVVFYAGCKYSMEESLRETRARAAAQFASSNDVTRATLEEQVAAQEKLVKALRGYARLARLQFDGGRAPYSTVLQAEEQLFPAELDWAAARAQLCASLVGIYKAMGGGWVAAAERLSASPTRPASSP